MNPQYLVYAGWFMGSCAAIWLLLLVFKGGSRKSPQEQADDDAEQVACLSQPLPLDGGVVWLTRYRENQKP